MRCSLVFALALSFVSSVVAAPLSVVASSTPSLRKRDCNPMPSKVDTKMRDFLYTYVRSKYDDPKILKIVMATAITESLVNNLDCGDQESHGMFQQKAPGYGWGSVADTMNPAKSTDMFLNALMPIYRKNPGLPVNVLAQMVQKAEAGDWYKNNLNMADRLIEEARKSVGNNAPAPPKPTESAPKPPADPKPTASKPGNGGAINVPVPAPTSTPDEDNNGDDDEGCDDTLPACDKFYVPVSGDNCYKVASKFGLKLDQFYQLNADLDAQCQNLYAGRKYCVAAADVN